MLVSHAKKFIYIKTVKTAGSSVEVALQDQCIAPDAVLDKMTPMLETDHGIVGARGPSVKDARWYNHMPAQKIRDQLPAEIWNSYCKICNIRNPWDKTVSWYHFQHTGVKDLSKDEVIAGFRAWLSNPDETRLGLDTNIYFIDDTPVADVYLRHSSLAEDYAALCDRLGIDAAPLPKLKSGQRGAKKIDFQDYYDAPLRDKVAELYARDIAHFGWTFDQAEPRALSGSAA